MLKVTGFFGDFPPQSRETGNLGSLGRGRFGPQLNLRPRPARGAPGGATRPGARLGLFGQDGSKHPGAPEECGARAPGGFCLVQLGSSWGPDGWRQCGEAPDAEPGGGRRDIDGVHLEGPGV